MGNLMKRISRVFLAAVLLLPAGWRAPAAEAAAEPFYVSGYETSSESSSEDLVILSQSFEDGQLGGWADLGWNGTGTAVVSAVYASEGNHSLQYTNRTDRKSSLSLDLTHLVPPGGSYDISFKLRSGQGTDIYHLASKVTDGGQTSYPWIIPNQSVCDTGWTAFELQDYQVPAGMTEFRIWIEADVYSTSSTAKADFYLDEVLIKAKGSSGGGTEEPPRDPALSFDTINFEDQMAGGFEGRAGTETLTVTDEANHTEGGTYALKVEGRTSTWHGPSLRVEKYVDKGGEYTVSAWVKLISPASSQLQLSTQIGNGSSANYVALAPKTISGADGWVQFEGTYRYNSIGDEYLTIYVESTSSKEASFYIDDISFENTGSGTVEIEKDLVPIQSAYADDFLIGNAITAEDLEGVRLELLTMHHNVATAGNAMKPDALQPTKGNFSFTAADAMVDQVLAEGMQMHGHVLVWHQQSPAWMNTAEDVQGNTVPLSREEALANLRTHIQTVMEHFGDRVISWDVVNEAMNDNPSNPADWEGALRKSPWYNAIGPDYVEQAFLAAREVLDDHPGWDIKLYYNDYNEDNRNKADAIYNMVQEINERYAADHPDQLLIDGIGMQAHYNVNTNPENMRLSLEKFISLGVEVSVTELDIQAGSNYELSDKLANAQGYLYAQLFALYREHADHIKRVTFWGLDDNTSWRASSNPLLFDKNLQAKPAYYGVIDPEKFMEEHQPDYTDANQSTAQYAIPAVDGAVDDVWNAAPEMQISRYQMAWQGASGTAKALWDDSNLYVLIRVNDAQLDKSSANVWEQDSVEVFLDENNAKTVYYQDDDGQFRVNYTNEASFNPTAIAEGFESAVQVEGTSYTVEMKIPFKTIVPENDVSIGFDVQINDGKDGARQSVATWNDTTGNGYQDTSVYGVLTLSGKPAPPGEGSGNNGGGDGNNGGGDGSNGGGDGSNGGGDGNNGGGDGGNSGNDGGNTVSHNSIYAAGKTGSSVPGSIVQPGSAEVKNGAVTITPETQLLNGIVQAAVSAEQWKQAMEQAAALVSGKKQIVIELPEQAGAESYEVQLPAQSLSGQQDFVLTVKTATAVLEFPSHILTGVSLNAEQVSIRLGGAVTDALAGTDRETVGSRPAIQLGLLVDGKTIAWNPNAAVKVSIPYTPSPAELEQPDQLVVWRVSEEGAAVPVPNGRYDAAAGAVVFETKQFGVFAVAYVHESFGDLERVLWAKQAIEAMAAREVIQGTGGNSFTPDAPIKRGDYIALLVRALELKGSEGGGAMFSDVGPAASYRDELAVAKELGIAAGYAGNTFSPDGMLTRQDMMVMTVRALAAAGRQIPEGGTLEAFSDAGAVSDYAVSSAAALAALGIVNGNNGSLAPHNPLTRAEAAAVLYRAWSL